MGFLHLFTVAMAAILLFLMCKVVYAFWVLPNKAHRKLRANGFGGPTPSFPLGNTNEMKKKKKTIISSSSSSSSSSSIISHDIHSSVFPFFAEWQKSQGKVFVYWLGTEPFLYIADPEFLKNMSSGVMGKSWGKPTVFKKDREPMFGNGLVMAEGEDWVRHRHVITPAFSPSNLKVMSSLMVESGNSMVERWRKRSMISNSSEIIMIDAEKEMISIAAEIIAKTSFGISYEQGRKVFDELRNMQITLFNSNRYVGVPFSKLLCPKQTMKAKRLGKEIDSLLLQIIDTRNNDQTLMTGTGGRRRPQEEDLLGLLLEQNRINGQKGKTLSTRELVDECKTFFFGGFETTALALTWTLLCLAMHPNWQDQLRQEIRQVMGGDGEIDATMLASLKKMGWVMNEVLRLYSPAPNLHRQARGDIAVKDVVIPDGTNMWVDVVSMHHDKNLWGEDVNEFKPERFKDDLYGGCKQKMGFLPFGFGGRMCIGRNLTTMEFKIVLTLILTRFSLALSPNYSHSPSILLSLRPTHGLPLILTPL